MKEKRRIVELKDESGVVFPQTHLNAVVDSNYRPLNEILEDIQAGGANLSDIREAIAELQEQIFPLTCSIRTEYSIYEYTGNPIQTKFITSVSFKNAEVDRKADISSFKIGISDGISELGDYSSYPKEIFFYLMDITGFKGYKSYSATLNVSLKNGRTTGSTHTFYQISPAYIGWSDYSSSMDWINYSTIQEGISDGYIKKVLKTNVSGTYEWTEVPAGKCFWILVPESEKFSGYSTVLGNHFPASMKDLGTKNIGSVSYRCIRNFTGSITVDSSWIIQLS